MPRDGTSEADNLKPPPRNNPTPERLATRQAVRDFIGTVASINARESEVQQEACGPLNDSIEVEERDNNPDMVEVETKARKRGRESDFEDENYGEGSGGYITIASINDLLYNLGFVAFTGKDPNNQVLTPLCTSRWPSFQKQAIRKAVKLTIKLPGQKKKEPQ